MHLKKKKIGVNINKIDITDNLKPKKTFLFFWDSYNNRSIKQINTQ